MRPLGTGPFGPVPGGRRSPVTCPYNDRVESEASGRRLAALVDAGIALASELDLDALLQRIADRAREVIGAGYAAVGVVGDGGELVRFVHSGIDEATVGRIGEPPRGRGLLGVLLEEGSPLRLDDISGDPRSFGFPPHHPAMRSFLGVPITVRGRVFGRLYLTEKREAGSFSGDDERLALTLAAQAGVAVENARLYDEIRYRSEELGRRLAELASVERVSRLLISEGSVDQVLRSACEEARVLTGASRATLMLLDEASGDLVVREAVGDRVAAGLVGNRLQPGTSKAHAVMGRMTSEAVADLPFDPEAHAPTVERVGRPRTGAFAPLVVRGKAVGVLAAYERAEQLLFSPDDLVMLQMIANQVAIALENERLSELLTDLAVLEERERISKELHDGVIQSIYSVGLSLQGATSLLTRDPERARGRIAEAISELDNVVRDVRSYIFELQPRLVAEKGLPAAIADLARELEINTLAHTSVDLDEEACAGLGHREQLHIWHVAKEVLSNVARHARATQVRVRCREEARTLKLVIEDDGVGFDPATVARGYGLINVEERARTLGGSFEIIPGDPRGTVHVLTIPRARPRGGDHG